MDVKEMREVAESVSEHTACGCDPSVGVVHCPLCDARYLAKLMLALTCPDPLTLDAAKAVMGREPDETVEREDRTRYEWKGMVCDLWLLVWKPDSATQLLVFDYWHLNLSIGQFACLVAAAKQGEKA